MIYSLKGKGADALDKQELVSIIVPVYKVEKYLDRCVESLISQTYENIEIILVDDGSPDNSGKLCDEWANKDKRIRVIHKKNSGVSATRNRGISESTGKYLVFVDSDDWLEQNAVELLYNKLIVENVDMVCGSYFINTDETEKEIITRDLYKRNEKFFMNTEEFKDSILKSFLNGKIPGYLWLFIIKKDLVIGDKPFKEDISLAEDLIFLIEIFTRAQSIYFYDVSHYHYYINQNGLTRSATYYRKNIKNMPKLTKHFEEIIENNWNDSDLIEIRRAASAKMVMSYIYAMFKQTEEEEFRKVLSEILEDEEVNKLLKYSNLILLDDGLKKYIERIFLKLLITNRHTLLIFLYEMRKKFNF